ncbi:MAG: lysylphosphatidylglycerol synthase transmembrane domain-containing protein [Patescibacteria group bacterium]
MHPARSNRGRLVFYAITIAAIIIVFLKFSELRYIGDLFRKSNWHYLGIVLVVEFFSYLAQALNFQAVLKIKQHHVGVWELFPISYVVQFISQAIPTGGLSGQVFFIYYLRRYGITFAEGFGRAILEVASLYTAYALYFITAAILLVRADAFQNEPRLVVFIYAVVIFFGICSFVIFLSQKRKRDSRIHWLFDRAARYVKKSSLMQMPGLRAINDHSDHLAMIKDQFNATLGWEHFKKNIRLFALASFWQVVHLMTHVVTLFVISHALGTPIAFWICFIAFTFSKFISMISIVPGAPGVFEGVMTLVLLAFGVDAHIALAATILTRAFTFWLPMPIGWILYHRYMRQFEKMNDNLVVS